MNLKITNIAGDSLLITATNTDDLILNTEAEYGIKFDRIDLYTDDDRLTKSRQNIDEFLLEPQNDNAELLITFSDTPVRVMDENVIKDRDWRGWDIEKMEVIFGKVEEWDVSFVKNMSYAFVFRGFENSFNKNISKWDTSSVSNMLNMFCGATSFNQPIGDWDVSNVWNMKYMFNDTSDFNQPIGSWNVSNVVEMAHMFDEAKSFNQPIGDWDVSNVVDMSGMFDDAYAFNQPIGDWDVSSVTDMSNMFNCAYAFNQLISNWDVSSVTDMSGMFDGGYVPTHPDMSGFHDFVQ